MVTALAVDASGPVLAVGSIQDATDGDFAVVEIDGGTRREIWRLLLDATDPSVDAAHGIVLDAARRSDRRRSARRRFDRP